jgi:hypothetical protein
VVEVAMRAQHDVNFLDVPFRPRTRGIAHDPGIDQNNFAARRFYAKSSVAQPSDFYAIEVHSVGLDADVWHFVPAKPSQNHAD